MMTFRWQQSLLVIALAGGCVWLAATWIFAPALQDDLRAADALFTSGQFSAANTAYATLAQRHPDDRALLLRRGMIAAVRGEYAVAQRTLAATIGANVRGTDHDLARLYQGHVAAADQRQGDALSAWATIPATSPLAPIRDVLLADLHTGASRYGDAEANARHALEEGLPTDWQRYVVLQMALLRGSSDANGAHAMLRDGAAPAPDSALARFYAPLLPHSPTDTATLDNILAQPAAQRQMTLGQIYMRAGWYPLAAAQFAAVPPSSDQGRGAAAFLAYTRWLAGDRDGGIQQLEQLVAAAPDDAQARALLATALIAARDTGRAQAQLDALQQLAPNAPDAQLAQAQWYSAQAEYATAAEWYARATSRAPADQRAAYAGAQARFLLDTGLNVCSDGLAAATDAATLQPDAATLTLVAQFNLACDDPAAAQRAAEHATQHDPASAEAALLLGEALANQGATTAARAALIRAADLAPASPFRARAERTLALLPP